MTGPDRSVLAIVLTHSAPDALVTCVSAVLDQSTPPAAVLVVDNAGRPSATTTLRAAERLDDRVEVVTAERNTGPAGGHALGLGRFLDGDADAAWILDDDCIPEPDCLAALLAAAGDGPLHLAPTWIQPDGTETTHPAWNGALLSRDVVSQAGLPRAELFWWAEDTEYLLWRIPAAGFPRRHVPAARVRHTRARATPRRPAWKYYYEARNTVYLRVRERHRPAKVPRILTRLAGRIVVREDHRVTKLGALTRGVADGLRGRLGIRYPVDTSTVVHVVSREQAAGAQVYARLLADALTTDDEAHVVVTLAELRAALRTHRPRLVVAHGGEPMLHLAGRPWSPPIIYYRIGRFPPSVARRPRRWLYRIAVRRCVAVAGVSAAVVDEAADLFDLPEDRLHVISNGRRPEDFQPEPPPERDEVHLLWLGRPVEHKRPEWFADAADALRADGLAVAATTASDRPVDEVPGLLADADVVCFTSRGDAEGMPGVLIEAGLGGRPVVTTAVAGAADVVDDGVTGLIVPVDDHDAFVAATARLAADRGLRLAMGAAARDRCVDRFSMAASAEQWRALLAEPR